MATKYTDCWLQGTRAQAALEEKGSCPHPYMSDQYLAWCDGWDDAAIISDPTNSNIGKYLMASRIDLPAGENAAAFAAYVGGKREAA